MARRPFSCRVDARKIPEGCDYRKIPVLSAKSYALNTEKAIGGDAPKAYLTRGNPAQQHEAFIAKEARRCGPRECATEQLISQIGRLLPLRVADSALVRLPTVPSKTGSVRFMSRYFLRPGEELIHGVELMAMWLDVEKKEMEEVFLDGAKSKSQRKEKERELYTVDCIYDVFHDLCVHGEFESVKDSFGRMLAFDALVGANDRHPMNWGVIRNVRHLGPLRFSPVFDTSRGLFWQQTDERLLEIDAGGRRDKEIEKYAEGSSPLLGCQHTDEKAKINHFGLIEYLLDRMPDEFRHPVVQVVAAYRHGVARRMMYKKFGKLLSTTRLELVADLLRYRHTRLKEICGV